MATRSLIGVYGGDDEWQCRYVHWDGYPSGVGVELCRIISRDGADRALRVLLDDNDAWSIIDHAYDGEGECELGAPHRVHGYGAAYWNAEVEGWIGRSDNAGCEWAYLITPHQAMMDVYAWDWDAAKWNLHGAMDCASRRLLTVKGELEVIA